MASWKPSSRKRRRAQGGAGSPIRRDAGGLVHLVVQQDAATGQQRVGLRTSLFRFDWQNRLAAGVADAAHRALANGPSRSLVATAAREAMEATSRLIDRLLSQDNAGRVACRAGCDHCCYQSVGVTTAEAVAIVAHLRSTRSTGELAELTTRLAAARERARGLSSKERFSPDHPCAFLRAGECEIYPVRPLSCRGMNSLDAEECRRMLHDPLARRDYLERGVGGQSFMEPIRAFHAVSAGLQLALSELHRLDMRPLDLAAAVHELLVGPESLLDDWLDGKPALAAARGGDSTDNPAVQRMSGAQSPVDR